MECTVLRKELCNYFWLILEIITFLSHSLNVWIRASSLYVIWLFFCCVVQNYVSSLNVSKQYFTSLLPFFLFPDKCMPFRLCLLTLSHSLQKKKILGWLSFVKQSTQSCLEHDLVSLYLDIFLQHWDISSFCQCVHASSPCFAAAVWEPPSTFRLNIAVLLWWDSFGIAAWWVRTAFYYNINIL